MHRIPRISQALQKHANPPKHRFVRHEVTHAPLEAFYRNTRVRDPKVATLRDVTITLK
jgi:hypothetical protein